MAPKGLPPAISKKLGEAIKNVVAQPAFQKVLTSFDVPYDYLDQEGLEKKIREQYAWFKEYIQKSGIKTIK